MICRFPYFLIVFAVVAIYPSKAETIETDFLVCQRGQTAFAPPDSPDHRKYAPDRESDILHVLIDVTPDFSARTVAGQTTIRFKPIAKPLTELKLDAENLTIHSVESSATVASFHATDKALVVTFAEPIPADQETSVTIRHFAQPEKGLYFRTPEMGYKPGNAHLFTQGEAIEARHWYPCFDAPNEKFTSEVICRVPEGMVALSNGRLLSQEKAGELVAFRWLQDKPHVNYLITLVAGYFKKVEDRYRDIPMAFYTPPADIDEALNSFHETKQAMAFFEQEIGVAYPWAKYDQVCLHDFVTGGMENTSITSLTDRTLFTSASENIRSSRNLMAHELAHQWFGDLVTCKDWSHIWLNEGFATYYAHRFEEHMNGRDALLYGLHNDAKGFLDRTDDNKPIVYRQYDAPMEQFSYLAYPKGSWVLHMLRSQLGDELFRRCVKTYLERHQYGIVVTEDLNSIVEELSGRSFDQFFDQWVYHAHHPELAIDYHWDAKSKLARVTISQNQKLSPEVLLFKFPITIRFKTKEGVSDHSIVVKQKAEDFYFPLSSAPEIVRIDPNLTVLAKIRFNVPDAMLYAQLADRSDVIGRLLAVEQLSTKKTDAAVTKLRDTLNADPFYGVRVEAAGALRSIHSESALKALIGSLDQPDARVRLAVVRAIGGFYRDEAYESLQSVLAEEKNPDIQARALQSLSLYGKPEVREVLLRHLNTPSYRNLLTETAIRAMRQLDDTSYIGPIREALTSREPDFTSTGIGSTLDTLAYLSRNEEKKDEIREFIARFARDKRRGIARSALSALGTLEDPKAIPLLETFAGANKQSPERAAAESAMAALRAGRKPSDNLRELRNEVLELQKANRELRKEFEELRKKLDTSKAASSSPRKPAGPRPLRGRRP